MKNSKLVLLRQGVSLCTAGDALVLYNTGELSIWGGWCEKKFWCVKEEFFVKDKRPLFDVVGFLRFLAPGPTPEARLNFFDRLLESGLLLFLDLRVLPLIGSDGVDGVAAVAALLVWSDLLDGKTPGAGWTCVRRRVQRGCRPGALPP